MRIEVGVGAEDQWWSSTGRVLGGRMIEKSGDVICDLHYARGDEEHGILGLVSKLRSMVSPGLASKLVATVLVVWHQNHSLLFSDLGLKTGSYDLVIWPTNHCDGFLVWASKPSGLWFFCCATKSMGG
jgi:hypothetical protein